jgi:hypothetical protein
MRRRVPILLCVLLTCSVLFGAVPAAGQQATAGTHLEAQLQADGDAEWRVTVRIPIDDERERERFEAFAARFEAGEGDLELGADAFERAVAEASAASGREMSTDSMRRDSAVVNVTEDGEVVERYGELRLEFTWASFARVEDDGTLYVDDAFNTTDGTWLPGLGPDQTLTIRAPPDYGAPTTSPIGADQGDLRWEGPATFEPGYFTIVYQPSSPGEIGDNGISTALLAGALFLSAVALFLGVYLLVARRRGDDEADAESDADSDREPAVGEATVTTAEGPTDASSTDAATGADADVDDGGRGEIGSPPPGADDADDEEPDLELLSDEERVEYLLEQNGGRMKQATIVKETGWSNAKVSQLLSAMDEDDQIDKLRIGRENLISLPGEGIGGIDEDVSDE